MFPLKKGYVLAIASLLLIPVVFFLAGLVFDMIDPEIAAGHPNYERNYRLLEAAKSLSLGAALFLSLGLWFLTCFFLLKSKKQSYGWLPLATFGPLGLIVLTMLRDHAPAKDDRSHRFLNKLNLVPRVVFELCLFVAIGTTAFGTMVLTRDLMILYESTTSGVPAAVIIERQNASSGMWAFGEGLEVLYLVALFYLLWPICFNGIARFLNSWRPKAIS